MFFSDFKENFSFLNIKYDISSKVCVGFFKSSPEDMLTDLRGKWGARGRETSM